NALKSLHSREEFRRDAYGFTKAPLKLPYAKARRVSHRRHANLSRSALEFQHRRRNRTKIALAIFNQPAKDGIDSRDSSRRRTQATNAAQFTSKPRRRILDRHARINQLRNRHAERLAHTMRMKSNAQNPRRTGRAQEQRSGDLPNKKSLRLH